MDPTAAAMARARAFLERLALILATALLLLAILLQLLRLERGAAVRLGGPLGFHS